MLTFYPKEPGSQLSCQIGELPMTLKRLVFLVHPFCYAASRPGDPRWEYAQREQRCAQLWEDGARKLGADEALAIAPMTGSQITEATDGFVQRVQQGLGERCIILDCPSPSYPDFWEGIAAAQPGAIVEDLREAFVGQGQEWSKEELHTALHARGCAAQLREELARRGMGIDPTTVRAEAWGESFDGCVTKYSLSLRRLLGLAHAIEIDFERAVPDARFLLGATLLERVEVGDELRLFLFDVAGRATGLFVATNSSLTDRPRRVHVPVDPLHVSVVTKQSGRLWPLPVEDRTPWPSPGLTEPPQELVHEEQGGLVVPVSAGYVFRLAKAPAYIMAEPGVSSQVFRDQLVQAAEA